MSPKRNPARGMRKEKPGIRVCHIDRYQLHATQGTQMGSHLGAVFSSPHQIIYHFMCKDQQLHTHTHVQDRTMIHIDGVFTRGILIVLFSFIKDAASIKQQIWLSAYPVSLLKQKARSLDLLGRIHYTWHVVRESTGHCQSKEIGD